MLIAFTLGIILVLLAILLFCTITNNNRLNMKLSGLAGALDTIDTNINTVKTSLDAFIATTADVELPADAQAALDKLTGDVATLSADVPAASPAPAPGV